MPTASVAAKEGRRAPSLKGITFSPGEVAECRERGGLLRLNIEVALDWCNLRCMYCYSDSGTRKAVALGTDAVLRIIDQVAGDQDLGVKSIVLTGAGEPLLSWGTYSRLVQHVRDAGIVPVTFTNGTHVTDEGWAKRLWDAGVTLVAKVNSQNNPKPTNTLSGRPWAYQRMWQAIQLLLENGFHADEYPSRLGVQSVITKLNYRNIPRLWKWLRTRNIYPYVELPKWQGRARLHRDRLELESQRVQELFETLLKIDDALGLPPWTPVPPIAARVCDVMYCGAYIRDNGDVQPCPGVEVPCGNVLRDPGVSLREIVRSDQFQKFRNVRDHVDEPCRSCSVHEACYGCRGAAFQEYGDAFAADPVCWHCR